MSIPWTTARSVSSSIHWVTSPWRKPPAPSSLPPHVVDPGDLSRVASGTERRLVDPRVHAGKLVGRGPSAGGHPAVGGAADESEGPAAAHSEPDADRMCRRRPGLHAGEPVVPAVEPDGALVRPHQADDLDGLDESVDRL